jgi:hypothetical protein
VFRGCLAVFPQAKRATGRGSADHSDEPQGRKITEPEPLVKQQPWEPKPLDEEQTRNNPQVIPIQGRPDVILRFSDAKTFLLDGLLDKPFVDCRTCRGGECAPGPGERAAVWQQPVYRGETVGTYAQLFNALLNYQHLAHESAPADKQSPVSQAVPGQETLFRGSPISEQEAGR